MTRTEPPLAVPPMNALPSAHLNKNAVPTAQGARAWSQATVGALLIRENVN
jgi:hypothetical protein